MRAGRLTLSIGAVVLGGAWLLSRAVARVGREIDEVFGVPFGDVPALPATDERRP